MSTFKTDKSIQVVNNIPITKEGVYEFAERLRIALLEGEINALDLKLHFKALDLVRESIKPELDSLALTQAEMYNKGVYKGFLISVQEAGTRYDFSGCNDPVWNRLEKQRVNHEKVQKNREAILKNIRQSTPMIDPETGEACDVFPPVKKSTTTIVLKMQP